MLKVIDQGQAVWLSKQCSAHWDELKEEMTRFTQHLHLLHIINPEVWGHCVCAITMVVAQVDIKLHLLNDNGEHQSYAEFHHEASRLLLKSRFKLVTSLHHYLPQPQLMPTGGTRRGKLRLVKGETVVLPCCVKPDQAGMAVDLQLCCAVALVPHKAVAAGKKICAGGHCTHVKVGRG